MDHRNKILGSQFAEIAKNEKLVHEFAQQYIKDSGSQSSPYNQFVLGKQTAITGSSSDQLYDSSSSSLSYPEGKLEEWLTPNSTEAYTWYISMSQCLDLLNSKLGSPRLRGLKKLWYSGYQYRDLKKLERSVEITRDIVVDINNKYITLDNWKNQYRMLKDLLCEIDDLLDDIAQHASQLNHLFQLEKQQPQPHQIHPYLIDILKRIGDFTGRLDALVAEMRSYIFNQGPPPAPAPLPTQSGIWFDQAFSAPSSMVDHDRPTTATTANEEISTFYALINPQQISEIMNMSRGFRSKPADPIPSDEIHSFGNLDASKSNFRRFDPVWDDDKTAANRSSSKHHDPVVQDDEMGISEDDDFDKMESKARKQDPVVDAEEKGKARKQDPVVDAEEKGKAREREQKQKIYLELDESDDDQNEVEFPFKMGTSDATKSSARKPDRIQQDPREKTRTSTRSSRTLRMESTSTSHMNEKNLSFNRLPEHLKRCFLYTSLFPRNYEFDKDTVVHFWIAAGFIQHERAKALEDIGGSYFDELFSMSFFEEAPLDYSNDKPKYKVRDDVYTLVLEGVYGEYARLEDGNLDAISEETLHSSVLCEIVDPVIFRSFHRLKRLHSLLLLHDNRNSIKQIPYDLFLNMKRLRVLDLSLTQIQELPSSVGDLEALCYLDLSKTSIKRLPESVCSLSHLQMLKLKDCLDFVELPKGMKDVTSLRHLDLDILRQLTFMSPRMGNLINLQTLSAFIVGKESGCQISELRYMRNLRGSLSIVKLENVIIAEEAEEAALYNKLYLRKVELKWSHSCLETEEILEGLSPHINIEELEIICYGGLKFPRWFGDSSYSKLSTVYLYNCKNCVVLPPLGRLPHLKTLYIGEMQDVKQIDHQFCGGGKVVGFPSLERLDFDGMASLENWVGIKKGGFPCLRKLTIIDCPKLVELPNLSIFKTLQHMDISLCPELPRLSEIPTSLQRLVITGCPVLEERCHMEGVDSQKIAEIPNVWINHHNLSVN